MGRSPRRWLASVSLIVTAAPRQQSLSIRVGHGDSTINGMRMRHAIESVVQVGSGEPFREAVSFLLPSSEPSAASGESVFSHTLQTNNRGMAVGRGLLPSQIKGRFRIQAAASLRCGTTAARLTQTNGATPSTSRRSKWIAIFATAGGAALDSIVLAHRGGSDSMPVRSIACQNPGSGTTNTGGPSFESPR